MQKSKPSFSVLSMPHIQKLEVQTTCGQYFGGIGQVGVINHRYCTGLET